MNKTNELILDAVKGFLELNTEDFSTVIEIDYKLRYMDIWLYGTDESHYRNDIHIKLDDGLLAKNIEQGIQKAKDIRDEKAN